MEKSCWKFHFHFLQFTKKAQKAIIWSKIHFFENFVIFDYKLLSFRILHLAHSKLVGTPCIHFKDFFKKYFEIEEQQTHLETKTGHCRGAMKQNLKQEDHLVSLPRSFLSSFCFAWKPVIHVSSSHHHTLCLKTNFWSKIRIEQKYF